jgi:hypothetical protein
VLRFLSADWLRAFDGVLRADRGLGARFAANPIAIAQEVTVVPPEVIRYVVVCDRDTAVALAQGSVNAQRALTSGRLKLRGEVDRLGAASGALATLGDLLAGLRADTEF